MPAGLLLSRDLLFISKVTGTASALGLKMIPVGSLAMALEQAAEGDTRLLLIDLTLPELDLSATVSQVSASTAGPLTCVAFGPHVAKELFEQARAAGCHEVLPRSRFSSELPALLRKWLAVE